MTYDALVQYVRSYLEREDQDFIDMEDTFIRNAEQKIAGMLGDMNTQIVATSSTAISVPHILKPALWRSTTSITVTIGGERMRLQPRTIEFLRDYWPDDSVTGTPRYYCDIDADYIMFAPTPGAAYDLEIIYQAWFDPLTASNQTNILTRNYPNVLTYGVLLEAVMWCKADDRLQTVKAFFDEAIAIAKTEQGRRDLSRNTTGSNA